MAPRIKEKTNSDNDMINAVAEIRNEKLIISEAAIKHNIAKASLGDRVSGR